jgi:SAM-dependent methyltransferase
LALVVLASILGIHTQRIAGKNVTQFNIAQRVLETFGPCRILHAGGETFEILSQLLLAGSDAWLWGKALPPHKRVLPSLDDAKEMDVTILRPVTLTADTVKRLTVTTPPRNGLALSAPGSQRATWDEILLANGWRRHPAALRPFEPLPHPHLMSELSLYQRIPVQPTKSTDSIGASERDILRIGGMRGDILIGRYVLASLPVRAGDTVVDCSCGAGGGTAVLAALSYGGRYIGVSSDPAEIAYAQCNYSGGLLDFRQDNPLTLDSMATASADCIIALDLPLDPTQLDQALMAFQRVVRPDGRVILGMRTPGRQHQAVDYLQKKIAALFIPESTNLLIHRSEVEESWHVIIASRDPTREPGAVPYRHPAFATASEATGQHGALLDFAGGYANPWIYRPLVQVGERLKNDEALVSLARRVVGGAARDSADRAAAITVIGYRILEIRNMEGARAIATALADFQKASAQSKNPHILRWRISTAFLAGRLAELLGEREAALDWFQKTSAMDWEPFSPILATKTVAAAFYAGVLLLANGDREGARISFRRGLDESLRAAAGNRADIVGNPEMPIPFGMQELAEVIDMGSQCALALHHFELSKSDPGLFWRRIDVKRFGLLTHTHNLERDNDALRAEIDRLNRVAHPNPPKT